MSNRKAARQAAKRSKAQSARAKKQPRHKDGRFKKQAASAYGRQKQNMPYDSLTDNSLSSSKKSNRLWPYYEIKYAGGKRAVVMVDKDGYVLRDSLESRLRTRTEDERKRSPQGDLNNTNKIVLPNRVTPEEIKAWLADPGVCDVEGIDTKSPKKDLRKYGLENSSKAMVRAQERIIILGATLQKEKEIRRTLDESFTASEINAMSKNHSIVVNVVSDLNAYGTFRSKADGVYSDDIMIRKDADHDTIVHEFVHCSRTRDTNRKGLLTTPEPTNSKRNLDSEKISLLSSKERKRLKGMEESATVAEATARTRKPAKNITGYYGHTPKSPGETNQTHYDDDRRIMTNSPKDIPVGDTIGSKGAKAKRTVEKRYEETHISDLDLEGKGFCAKKDYRRFLKRKH